jgi:hypothetical protein
MIIEFSQLSKLIKKLIADSYEQITFQFHIVPLWYTLNQQRLNSKYKTKIVMSEETLHALSLNR